MNVVIIGGVAGGATAAARLRRLDEQANIIVLERTGYVSYANCGLPYYVGGVITDREKLTLQTPESFRERFNIDVRVKNEVTAIDRKAKTVAVRRLDDGSEYSLPYDKLVLSPGAHAIMPKIPGIDSDRLFTLRTVEDTYAISDYIEQNKPDTATIIGAGFIGMEMAENLSERGIDVTIVQRDPHVMPTFDADMTSMIHYQIRSNGVRLHLNSLVTGFESDADSISTLVEGRDPIKSDFAIMAIGVLPESTLASDAGLELGMRGSIKTDDHMRTSDPDIYAVGDAVEVESVATHEPALIALAGPANKQGRIAADNIAGIDSRFAGSQGSSVMKLFEETVASTGITCEAAEAAGIDYGYVLLSPANHATYYPKASAISLKVVFEKPTGRILGAQAIGRDGVEKRIDVVATAMRANMTADDLTELDLTYAPPYSAAKDPVNMAGYMIQDILTGLVKQMSWDEALACEDAHILDVRTDRERSKGHIEGAQHIPLDSLRERIEEVPKDGKLLLVHCTTGLRSYIACRILSQLGYDCVNIAGGYLFYDHINIDRTITKRDYAPCGLPLS